MKQIKIKATFIGENMSMGFITGVSYVFYLIQHPKYPNIRIDGGTQSTCCDYSNTITFLNNWANVEAIK